MNVVFSLFSFIVFSIVLLSYNLNIFLVFLVGSIIYGLWVLLFLKRRRLLDYQYFEKQGQRQRILIARAVYKDPQILFFDEATNALDANNERAIVENLNEFYKGKTVVVVAHRLSTVRKADNIVVLEHGEIVEQGTHAKLTALKGRYYELVKNQLELGN